MTTMWVVRHQRVKPQCFAFQFIVRCNPTIQCYMVWGSDSVVKHKYHLRIWLSLYSVILIFPSTLILDSRWPRDVRRRSAAARLLRSWDWIPPGAWMFVCCECFVLSGRGLCDELIIRPEESYRLWCVIVCDLETSRMRSPWPALGRSATGKKNNNSWFLRRKIWKKIWYILSQYISVALCDVIFVIFTLSTGC